MSAWEDELDIDDSDILLLNRNTFIPSHKHVAVAAATGGGGAGDDDGGGGVSTTGPATASSAPSNLAHSIASCVLKRFQKPLPRPTQQQAPSLRPLDAVEQVDHDQVPSLHSREDIDLDLARKRPCRRQSTANTYSHSSPHFQAPDRRSPCLLDIRSPSLIASTRKESGNMGVENPSRSKFGIESHSRDRRTNSVGRQLPNIGRESSKDARESLRNREAATEEVGRLERETPSVDHADNDSPIMSSFSRGHLMRGRANHEVEDAVGGSKARLPSLAFEIEDHLEMLSAHNYQQELPVPEDSADPHHMQRVHGGQADSGSLNQVYSLHSSKRQNKQDQQPRDVLHDRGAPWNEEAAPQDSHQESRRSSVALHKDLPYIIPGPAGAVQPGLGQHTNRPLSASRFGKDNAESSRVFGTGDADFLSGPWLSAMDYIKKTSVKVSSIRSIKMSRTENRIPKLAAVIKTCTPNGCGDVFVNVKDLSDSIGGTINRKVMTETEFGRLVEPGAVILLHQVAVFSPTPFAHYLNITMNNVEQVFGTRVEFSKGECSRMAANSGKRHVGMERQGAQLAGPEKQPTSSRENHNYLDSEDLEVIHIKGGYKDIARGAQQRHSEIDAQQVARDDYDQLLDDMDLFNACS